MSDFDILLQELDEANAKFDEYLDHLENRNKRVEKAKNFVVGFLAGGFATAVGFMYLGIKVK